MELKQTFGTVDMVRIKGGDLYVFDIGGNKYRLVAAIHFQQADVVRTPRPDSCGI